MHFRNYLPISRLPEKVTALSKQLANRSLLVIRAIILAISAFVCFGGHFPPVFAQQKSQRLLTMPVITTEDAMQDDHISAINQHLMATDVRVTASEERINEWMGEERVVEGVIGLLAVGGLVLQIRQQSQA